MEAFNRLRRNIETVEDAEASGFTAPPSFFAGPLKFRGAGLELQSFRGREAVISGPAETGKTLAALWLLDSLLRETPRAQATLLRKLQVTVWGTVLLSYKRIQELRSWLGDEAALPYGGEKPEFYRYPNGARLWVGGLDNAGKILSGERDWIYVNQAEEFTEDDWQVLTTRTTGRGAVTLTPMTFGDCNPSDENHWILRRPSLKLFHSKHEDNPALYDDDGKITPQGINSIATLDALSGTRKQRLRYGKWVGVEGQFFEEWDEELHVCDPFPIPADWPVWGALDYGHRHPTAFGLFTKGTDGVVYMIAEHVQNKWLVPAHCKAIRAILKQVRVLTSHGAELIGMPLNRVKRIVAGHDCFQQRGDREALTIAEQYQMARDPATDEAIGLKLERANVDRVTGSQELVARLGNAAVDIPPTLKFFRNCKRTIAAMPRMVGDPLEPDAYKKLDANASGEGGDDEIDMARYGVMAAKPKATVSSGRVIGIG